MAKVKVDPDVQKLIDEYNSAYNILCRSGEFLYGARLSAAKTIKQAQFCRRHKGYRNCGCYRRWYNLRYRSCQKAQRKRLSIFF